MGKIKYIIENKIKFFVTFYPFLIFFFFECLLSLLILMCVLMPFKKCIIIDSNTFDFVYMLQS